MIASEINTRVSLRRCPLSLGRTMNEEYYLSDEYQALGAEVLAKKRPELLELGISVGFVSCTKKKTKGRTHIVFGECKKTQDLYKVFCPYDFLIIIYDQNCAAFNDDQMRTLLWHELLHIEIPEKGKPYVRPHDVEEFDEIIQECGLRWDR